jgi:hypothetical protein
MNINDWNSANDNNDKALAEGSPLCPDDGISQDWLSFESSFRCLRQSYLFCFHALAGIKGDSISSQVHFNLDSFPIRINDHASYYMANSPHLFDNLILSDVGKVDGINDGLAFSAREHLSSASLLTMAECITFASPTLSTYLNCMVASCHHNIGRRRQETIKHGWEILHIAASCIGLEARRRSLFTPPPTRQSSIWLPPQARTGSLWPHSR